MRFRIQRESDAPDTAILKTVVEGRGSDTDELTEHMSQCSPCTREFLEFQKVGRKWRNRRVAVVVSLGAIAAAILIWILLPKDGFSPQNVFLSARRLLQLSTTMEEPLAGLILRGNFKTFLREQMSYEFYCNRARTSGHIILRFRVRCTSARIWLHFRRMPRLERRDCQSSRSGELRIACTWRVCARVAACRVGRAPKCDDFVLTPRLFRIESYQPQRSELSRESKEIRHNLVLGKVLSAGKCAGMKSRS